MNERQNPQKTEILKPDAAIRLWQAGKDEWNQWVSEYPEHHISFWQVDFSTHRTEDNPVISFAGFIFPKGDVYFTRATFGEGNVKFDGATFGEGEVSFDGATFGKGTVSFCGTTFGEGDVNFDGTTFGEGYVSFEDATFGEGDVSFYAATFGEGEVDFDDATFGEGEVRFENITCKARFNLTSVSNIQTLSFRGAIFDNSVAITNVELTSIVDLVNTKLSHQLSLHGLSCHLNRTRNQFCMKVAKDKNDIERLNRAKELAETNKHHALALAFNADEMRARRWQTGASLFSSVLDLIFDKLCNYGQSVLRPFIFLLLSIMIFTVPYTVQSDTHKLSTTFNPEMLVFSAANSMPFLTSTRGARENGIAQLFNAQEILAWVYATMIIQGVVSVILLFLIGLGLRNRFRI